MVPEETRQQIDSMLRHELQAEIDLGIRSRFQREKYAYLQTRLKTLEEEGEAQQHSKELEVARDANTLTSEANNIAAGAARTAEKAYWVSVVALLVAVAAVIVTIFTK